MIMEAMMKNEEDKVAVLSFYSFVNIADTAIL